MLLKNIRKTLEQMSENEEIMDGIQDEILSKEKQDEEDEALARIDGGQDLSDEDYQNDGRENQESKLETVKEGNET